jgi:hypothetical protein
MSPWDKQRRAFAAQAFSAVAFFVFAHGAHAATAPAHAHAVAPGHAAVAAQSLRP